MSQYVIIGNGVACAGCIEGIRSVDTESKITVISEENHPVYCRPLISYYLEGKTDFERMKYRNDNYYEDMNCDILYGKKAIKIDNGNKTVLLDDGTSLPYTSVCVATGSSPFVPTLKGLETVENKFSFMTMDDTLALENAVNENSKVLIIGAGLIGLKCAEGLRERVKSITVCDLADRVLSSILDKECADRVQNHLESNGIQFMLSDTVNEFNKNTAVMKSGKEIEFDAVVLAIGVRANTSLVNDIGGEVNRGIIVNDRMETSVPDIYAAGDCTEGTDISCGEKKVMAIFPNAYMQGRTAGVNMAGSDAVFDKAIPMNSIGFFGFHIMTAGTYTGEKVYEEKTDDSIKKLFVNNNRLVGFILVGNTQRAGIYTSLIRGKTPLDSIDFDLLQKNVTTVAFSSETRRKFFGGVV